MLRLLTALLVFLGGHGPARAQTGSGPDATSVPRVLEVRVAHLAGGTVDPESVLVYVGVEAGQPFSRMDVTRDVRTLKDTGRFSSVRTDVQPTDEGVIVVYSVHPRPVIRKLTIRGAKAMSNKKVKKKMELSAGDFVDDSILAVKSHAVIDAYRKKSYPNARLEWEIIEEATLDKADVAITIVEGRRAKVKRIEFPGARDDVSTRILRKAMVQKRVNFLSWISGRGAFNPDLVEGDRIAIRKVLQNHGYLDAVVGAPDLEYVGARVAVAYPVTQGQQYVVQSIEMDGNELLSDDDIRTRAFRVRPGEIAALDKIEATAELIRDSYGSRGYIRSRADPEIDVDEGDAVVDVVYRIREGSKALIRNIAIQGNTRTKDKVIRRELTVAPQEIFDEVRVRQSVSRLRNLGFFSYVNATEAATDQADTYDLIFEVEEQRSGQFVFGAGFSSIDDIIGFVELSQGNFDLLNWGRWTGGGQKFKVRLQLGTERRDWVVSFTEPWFFDQRLRLDGELFQHERRFLSDDYDQLNTGGSVSLTRPMRGPYRLQLRYSLEEISVTDIAPGASDLIKSQEGSSLQSALGASLIRDNRDNFFIPTRGSRTVPSALVSGGPLGGDIDLYELRLRSTHFFPVWHGHIFNVRGQIATLEAWGDTEIVPIFDRLFLGGARNMRGFDFRDVGPKDENGESIGGQSLIYLTLEYSIPMIEQVRAATFYDVGQVYQDPYDVDLGDLNSNWGLGLRLDMPGFPLQVDYAWPIEADEFNDSSGRFNFFIGYQN